MRSWQPLVAAVLVATALAGCEGEAGTLVIFETSLGEFRVEMLPDHAPVTVANFLQYVDDGFYDGTTFHRIFPGFVVQGGGFEYVDDEYVPKEPRDPIVNEATLDEPNLHWTLSMARTNLPDSATSQFFVNLDDNDNLDPRPGTGAAGAGYAVFAQVVEGFETIEAMTEVAPGESFGSAGGYYPAEPIHIERAYRV